MNKNTNLIAICGGKKISKGSGKDTVANVINEILFEQGKEQYELKQFAYLLKKFASELTGIPLDGWYTEEDKNKVLGSEWNCYNEFGILVPMKRRMFLTKLGSDACNDHLHKNTWVIALFKNWLSSSKWIISDLRLPQEYNSIIERKGIVIRVTNPKILNSKETHISEIGLDNHNDMDYEILNDGTIKELKEKVKYILFDLKLI